MKKYLVAFAFFLGFCIPQDAGATAYYTDFSAAAGGNGLATSTAFNSIDAFTEVARTAGDILFVRRGVSTTTNITSVTFTSDGTVANSIYIHADAHNLWGDFSTSSQTYTVTVGTTTLIANASVTGIAAGDWVYVAGDCTEETAPTTYYPCDHQYLVETVSGTNVNLYMPYTGNQSGSGLSLRRMPSLPYWDANSGAVAWQPQGDDYWVIDGIKMRATPGVSGGVISVGTNIGWVWRNSIIEHLSISRNLFNRVTDSFTQNWFYNTLFLALGNAWEVAGGVLYNAEWVVENSYYSCQGQSGQTILGSSALTNGWSRYTFQDFYIANCGTRNGGAAGEVGAMNTIDCINCYATTTNRYFVGTNGNQSYVKASGFGYNYVSRQTSDQVTATKEASSTALRAGGGPMSYQFYPTADLNSGNKINHLRLFEYPIYAASTSAKTYDVYFKTATATAQWSADPTAEQFWVECEYWAQSTVDKPARKVKKSTGVLDFNGSTSWQALSVSCQPTQDGVLYLRGWYSKPKESGLTNSFLMDGTPVIN